MKVVRKRWDGADPAPTAASLRKGVPAPDAIAASIGAIVDRVRAEGDSAVLELGARFDGVMAESLRVPAEAATDALESLDRDLVSALEAAAENVEAVADAQLRAGETVVEPGQGQRISISEVPVGAAGIYVPGGRAPYPSTVLMGAIPARCAGVERVVVATPAGEGGLPDPPCSRPARSPVSTRSTRWAAPRRSRRSPSGTEIGAPGRRDRRPGRALGAGGEARRLALDRDRRLRGPLGARRRSRRRRAARLDRARPLRPGRARQRRPARRDLRRRGHRRQARVRDRPARRRPRHGQRRRGDAGRGPGPRERRRARRRARPRAPRALLRCGRAVRGEDPARRLRASPARSGATAFGDYAAGSNHVLPTGGAGRFTGPLGPGTFRRRISVVEMDTAAAVELGPIVDRIARAEGFEVHGISALARSGTPEPREDD